MANYYYDRYRIIVNYYPDPSWTEGYEWVKGKLLVWNNFQWDYTTARYVGIDNLGERTSVELWLKYYVPPNGEYVKWFNTVLESNNNDGNRYGTTTRYRKSSVSKGELLQSDIVLDETFPSNGIQSGYWYVRKGVAFPKLDLRINGVIKTVETGSVRINGELRQIDWMWVKVNGILKSL